MVATVAVHDATVVALFIAFDVAISADLTRHRGFAFRRASISGAVRWGVPTIVALFFGFRIIQEVPL